VRMQHAPAARAECAMSARICVHCGMDHLGVGHPVQLCKCGHCTRVHSGSYGYGNCHEDECECTWYARDDRKRWWK